MPSVADILPALKSQAVAIAWAILIFAIAARIIHRVAFYALVAVLVVLGGAFWTAEFLEWMG